MRKDAVVHLSSEGLEKWLKETQNLTIIEGHARLFLRSGVSMRCVPNS